MMTIARFSQASVVEQGCKFFQFSHDRMCTYTVSSPLSFSLLQLIHTDRHSSDSHKTLPDSCTHMDRTGFEFNCLLCLCETRTVHTVIFGIISHVRSQPAGKSTPLLRPTFAIGHMTFVWTTGKRACNSMFDIRVITNILSRDSSIFDTKCYT